MALDERVCTRKYPSNAKLCIHGVSKVPAMDKQNAIMSPVFIYARRPLQRGSAGTTRKNGARPPGPWLYAHMLLKLITVSVSSAGRSTSV